jgi:glucose/arabinose dehydrogenase
MRVPAPLLASFAILATTAGLADAQSGVLTGEAAFGGWQQAKPGVARHITVDDLPAPYATKSAANSPATVARPADALPQVPAGFRAELVATGFRVPRAMAFAPNGDLFIADSGANAVIALHFEKGAAKPSAREVFASSGLDQPYGIAFYPAKDPQWVYVANSGGLVRFPYKSGDLKASGGPETLLSGIPRNHHWTRDIAFSPDGKTLFYSVGSGSNVAEGMSKTPPGGVQKWAADHPLGLAWGPEQDRAAVLAMDPDGKNARVYATGLRNCSGLGIEPGTGEPWCVVNERDDLGNNLPFDYATHVAEGYFYGWPWFYIGGHEDPRHKGERADLAGKVTVPDVLIQAHSAPLGIAFYDSDAFGPGYKGAAFVTLHGSWNRSERTGYKVVKLDFDGSGKPTGVYEDFMTGFVLPNGDVWGRPVGVAVSPDGNLYVSEDGSDSIWKVSRSR